MCGIAGFWRKTSTRDGDCRLLEQMSDRLVHRGPDDYGYLFTNTRSGQYALTQDAFAAFAPDLFLANRRLAITDLSSAARQPICNEAATVFVILNGAIHNYVELRTELIALGHTFLSQSDTEVLLRAYEQWGEDCAARFNGMWAYVIWDDAKKTLVCSRDRFGIKPFYIANINDTFYFASEVKSILVHSDVPCEPNLQYIRNLISGGIPLEGNGSAFEHITQIPAGHNLIIRSDNRRLYPYWNYTHRSMSYDYTSAEASFNELFSDAVKIRLRGDVPVALLLSGGMDSASIASKAAGYAPGQLQAFTATFKDFADDEAEYAQHAADHADMPLNFVEYSPQDLLGDIKRAQWHLEVPIALGQILARWSLLGAAADHAKVVLEGQGADEALAGYLTYTVPYLRSLWQNSRSNGCRHSLIETSMSLSNPQLLRELGIRLLNKAPGAQHIRPDSYARQQGLLGDRLQMREARSLDHVADSPFDDPLSTSLWLDHSEKVLPYLLHFGDSISMGQSVESRLPFLDHRLVEFAFGLPLKQKVCGRNTKVILRNVMKSQLAKETLQPRKKVGFSTPFDKWLAPIMNAEIRPLLTSQTVINRGIFNPVALNKLMNDYQKNGHGAQQLLRCVATELWFQQFIDA